MWRVTKLHQTQSHTWLHSVSRVNLNRVRKKRVWSISSITSSNTDRFLKFFHYYNLHEICNKAIVKYPTTPQTRHYTTLWNIDVKTNVSPALWQFYWKINSPESWRVAGSNCIFKWNLFTVTSFTNSLYHFSIVFVIISRRFFVISNNVIKNLWGYAYWRS